MAGGQETDRPGPSMPPIHAFDDLGSVPDPGPPPRRVKVVLADRRGARRVLRTLSEVEEQTSIGEKLVQDLVRAQLRTSLLAATVVFGFLAALPVVFFVLPASADEIVLGYRLPWLILVAVPFPLMVLAGRWYHQRAGRHERDFVNMVEN